MGLAEVWTLTCGDEAAFQRGGAQARAGVVHGGQRTILTLLQRALPAQALEQAGRGRRGALRRVAPVQEDHAQRAVQHRQTQVGVICRERGTQMRNCGREEMRRERKTKATQAYYCDKSPV